MFIKKMLVMVFVVFCFFLHLSFWYSIENSRTVIKYIKLMNSSNKHPNQGFRLDIYFICHLFSIVTVLKAGRTIITTMEVHIATPKIKMTRIPELMGNFYCWKSACWVTVEAWSLRDLCFKLVKMVTRQECLW